MDFFYENSIYVVLGIVLIIWFGIFLYIFNIDKKLSKLEIKIHDFQNNQRRATHEK